MTGNAKQPFNRLVDLALSLSIAHGDELVIQNGVVTYSQASSCRQIGVVANNEFIELVKRSSFVVTHAGAGTLRTLNSHFVKSICVPRLARYGEHVNDHQVQIAIEFARRNIVSLPGDYLSSSICVTTAYQSFIDSQFDFKPISDESLNERVVRIVSNWLAR